MAILNAFTLSYLRGTTNTAGALNTMRTNLFNGGRGDRGNFPNVGILVTDGRSNDFQDTWRQARQVRECGSQGSWFNTRSPSSNSIIEKNSERR